MSLTIFDLDKTLIGGDSDYLWGEFLCEIGVIEDVNSYQKKNEYYFQQYDLGYLDIDAYLEFCLEPLSRYSFSELDSYHKEFMRQKIEPILLEKAQKVVDQHKSQGDTLLVITATNSFITWPIVRRYGIENLIATEPEVKDGRFTGKVSGIPCYKHGKIDNLMPWLKEKQETLTDSTFYSDSNNDLPLLRLVNRPVAVNADPILTEVARQNGWEVLNWMS
jgi:HAD superfamily hydrolase (TIGR01490 family)